MATLIIEAPIIDPLVATCQEWQKNPATPQSATLIRCFRNATRCIVYKAGSDVQSVKVCHTHAVALRKRGTLGDIEIISDDPIRQVAQ